VPAVDLVTVGEAFEDLIFVGLTRLPRLGEEVKTNGFMQTLGGGAIITAVAARRLGTRCRVVSGLSPAAAQLLRREGIAVTDLRRPGERHAISAALSTAHNRAFVTFNGINAVLEQRLFAPVTSVSARHAHFAFYPRQCARWRRVLAALRRKGITTSWDFGWNEGLATDPAFLPLVAELEYVFLNEQEALLYSRKRRLLDAWQFWRTRARAAIVKLGAAGSRWIAAGVEIEERPPEVRVVDTTGAGDAYNGGFLAARLAGRSPRGCLRAGNRIGALSTRAPGGIDGLPRRRNPGRT
jgi:sugar/nucleoside kinase (ribokinase family)